MSQKTMKAILEENTYRWKNGIDSAKKPKKNFFSYFSDGAIADSNAKKHHLSIG